MPRDVTAPSSPVFRFIERRMGATISPGARLCPLPGGAVLQHYLLEFDLAGVPQRWVLRTDGATKLGIGLSRAREFALQRTLFRAGLKVAEPLFMCCDPAVLGAPFFLMRFLPGDARGVALVARGAQPALAEELGRELARLHALELRYALHCLPAPPHDAAEVRIAELEALLAADDDPHPVGEWALRWLKQMKPDPARVALCHGDFRTGNYLVAEGRLAGVLDWDFAHWGDPDEDIAWFCAKAWRFGAVAREAGGLAPRADFYRGYEVVSGRRIEVSRVRYWEVMAALRWLVIALKQRDRFLRQGERSLDLALTGRRVAECELELLLLILGGRAPKEANWISRGDGEPPACAPENPMRDRPSGATLAALAREVGGEEEFVTRCFAIAEREARLGDAVFAPVSASLDARYGKGNGAALTQLVAELRAGAFDRPGDARQWLISTLWDITRAKLRGSDPELLAAAGLN